MKRILLAFLVATSLVGGVVAEERIDLTSAYQPDTRVTTALRVNSVALRWGETVTDCSINIEVSSGTIRQVFNYSGQSARTMITALNKANLSTNSLQKRILNQLISDGYLSGTISGSAD